MPNWRTRSTWLTPRVKAALFLPIMPRTTASLFDEYWWTGKEHLGIIVSEQLPIGELLRRVLRFLNTVTADEMRNNYKNLGEFAER